MKTRHIPVQDDVRAVLETMTFEQQDGLFVGRIPAQLDRKQYLAVNKVLTALGGKWSRKAPQITAVILDAQDMEVEKDDFFRTPPVVGLMHVEAGGKQMPTPILEPSAGDGAIADLIVAHSSGLVAPQDIHVVEINPRRRAILASKGYQVVGEDFLAFNEQQYPCILMNPPFSNGQDIEHVTHAFRNCLALGGRLVAIMSEGPFFREDRRSVRFREELLPYREAEPLNEDAFKASGTMVRTRLVVLGKPERAEAAQLQDGLQQLALF